MTELLYLVRIVECTDPVARTVGWKPGAYLKIHGGLAAVELTQATIFESLYAANVAISKYASYGYKYKAVKMLEEK